MEVPLPVIITTRAAKVVLLLQQWQSALLLHSPTVTGCLVDPKNSENNKRSRAPMVTMVRMNRLLICWTGSRKTRGQDAQNWAAPKSFPLIKQRCPHPLALKLSHPLPEFSNSPCAPSTRRSLVGTRRRLRLQWPTANPDGSARHGRGLVCRVPSVAHTTNTFAVCIQGHTAKKKARRRDAAGLTA